MGIDAAEIRLQDGFTSKELDPTTSLYYGVYPAEGRSARYYDAWSGRWMSVDPLAKKYPGWGPYNYAVDNPLRVVDPTGLLPNFIDQLMQESDAALQKAKEYGRQFQTAWSKIISGGPSAGLGVRYAFGTKGVHYSIMGGLIADATFHTNGTMTASLFAGLKASAKLGPLFGVRGSAGYSGTSLGKSGLGASAGFKFRSISWQRSRSFAGTFSGSSDFQSGDVVLSTDIAAGDVGGHLNVDFTQMANAVKSGSEMVYYGTQAFIESRFIGFENLNILRGW